MGSSSASDRLCVLVWIVVLYCSLLPLRLIGAETPTQEGQGTHVDVPAGGQLHPGTADKNDKVRIEIERCASFGNIKVIPQYNSSPLIVLSYAQQGPLAGDEVTTVINGFVAADLCQLAKEDITVNGETVDSIEVDSQGNVQFSRQVAVRRNVCAFTVIARNRFGNTGYAKILFSPIYENIVPQIATNGAPLRIIKDRHVEVFDNYGRAYRQFGDILLPKLMDYTFRLKVIVGDAGFSGNTLTASVRVGTIEHTVECTKAPDANHYLSPDLIVVPEELNAVPGKPIPLKSEPGSKLYAFMTGHEEIHSGMGLVVGVRFLNAAGSPVENIGCGLGADLFRATPLAMRLLARFAFPGDWGPFADVDLTTFDYAGIAFVKSENGSTEKTPPFVQSLRLYRLSNNPDDGRYNIYESRKPLLLINSGYPSEGKGNQYFAHRVVPGGFVRIGNPLSLEGKLIDIGDVESVAGMTLVNIPIDGLGANLSVLNDRPSVLSLINAGCLPNLQSIISGAVDNPVVRFDARTTFPSLTLSCWSSWATGVPPGVHGLAGHSFYRRNAKADPFGSGYNYGNSELIDHVNVGEITDVADPDWSGIFGPAVPLPGDTREGAVNLLLRQKGDGVFTLYERLADEGVSSIVFWNHVYRGTSMTLVNAQDWMSVWNNARGGDALPEECRRFDAGFSELMESKFPSHQPPSLLTMYYYGLDHYLHKAPYPQDTLDANYLLVVDHYIGSLVRQLHICGLYEGSIFHILGDHGMTPISSTRGHLSYNNAFVLPFGWLQNEYGHFRVLLDHLQSDYDVVFCPNGGMAHIYIRSRSTRKWPDPPQLLDVVRVATRLFENDRSGVDSGALKDAFDLILIRPTPGRDFKGEYVALEKDNSSRGFKYTPISRFAETGAFYDGALAKTLSPDFSYAIQELQDIRSGDIIVLPRYSKKLDGTLIPGVCFQPNGEEMRYHGSLYASDMTIPMIFSAGKAGLGWTFARDAILFRIGDNRKPVITDVAHIEYDILTNKSFR